jgi:hypothetical protein
VDSTRQLSLSFFRDDFFVYSDSAFAPDLWISSDIMFLTIPCASHDSIFAIDLMCRSWNHLHYCFHTSAITQFSVTSSTSTGLSFRLPFIDLPWHSDFDNSMRQPWLYFCYRFDASVVNSLTLWIPHASCRSVFSNDFKVYDDSVFANDLWISSDIAFLTIPCVNHDSIFAIDSIRELALSF